MNFSWVLFCESVITGSHAVIMHVRIWIYSNVTLLNSLFTRLAMHFIWTRYISFSNYNLPNPIHLQPICPRPCPQKIISGLCPQYKTIPMSDSKLSVFRSSKNVLISNSINSNVFGIQIKVGGLQDCKLSYEFMCLVMSKSGRSYDSKWAVLKYEL